AGTTPGSFRSGCSYRSLLSMPTPILLRLVLRSATLLQGLAVSNPVNRRSDRSLSLPAPMSCCWLAQTYHRSSADSLATGSPTRVPHSSLFGHPATIDPAIPSWHLLLSVLSLY